MFFLGRFQNLVEAAAKLPTHWWWSMLATLVWRLFCLHPVGMRLPVGSSELMEKLKARECSLPEEELAV